MSPTTSLRPKVPVILLVEDQPEISASVAAMLRDDGYGTTCVSSLEDARRFLTAIQPDCVILDFSLPDGDAEELLEELTLQGIAPRTVLLSAAARAKQIAERFEIALVKKPFEAELLFSALREALDSDHRPRDTTRRIKVLR